MSFRCECPPGYSGPTCGEDVNECLQDDLCQNGGTCYNSYGGYFCDCPDGFTGLQCETNIDDCEEGPCENDATCVDLVNGYRCECPPFYEGFNCEKRKLPNFDLYFCMEDRASAQSPTLPFSATVYTYMFWIRYACEDENSNATPFQLLESENADMSDYNVRHEIPTSSSFKILEDTKWHHVAMSWSSASGDLHWYIDGSEVLSRENVDTGVTTPTWLKIFFGRPYESTTNTKAFHGEISQFNMYSREWSAEEIYNASNDCSKRDELGDIVDWVYCSYLLVGCSHVIRPSICGDSSCPADDIYRGCACTDKEPPEVIECPDVVRIVDPENHLVPCDYEEPSFLDNVGVADMTCSIVRGTTLAWGVYYVNCIATDEAGNSAVCGFSLYIIPFDCEDPAPPIKGSKTCDMWHSGHFCNIACNAGHEFSELPKPFYVCGNDGSWDPANPDEPFVFPGCSRTDPADALCEGSIMYTVSDCNPEDPYGLEEPNSLLRQAFIDRMTFADTMYGICGGTGCDFTNTVITCDEVSNRRKRQADQTSAEIAFAFNSSTSANDGSSIDNTLETAAFNGDLNAPGFTADPNTIDSTTSFSCPEGRILNGESCVYCAEGEFHNVTEDECQKCPKGSYQSEEGKVSCNQCGEQKTTAGKGATSASECLVSCNVGYANKDGRCQPCQIGMYQDEPAKFSCKACPSGMSTANAASISLDDCEVKCMQAGKQLGVSGNCEPCPVGTYGLQGVTSCARCPYGFTTSVTGAVSADECNVVECNSGSYKKRPSDNCEPCPIGEYQSRLGASYCYKCPPHYTTSTVGSVREEQCYICEEGVQCNPDPCENNYCGNDGTCSVDRLGEPVCECINGASGDRCQVAELCNNYCENEGVCSIDSRGYPACSCESEWTGDRCHLEAKKFGGRSITNKKQLAGIVGGSLTAVIVLISIAYFLTVRHLKKKRGPLYPSEPPPEYKTHIMYDNAIYDEVEDFKKPGELESEPQSQAAVDKQIYHYNYAYQEEKEPQPSTSGSSGNSTPKQLPTQGDVHVDVTTPGGVRFDS
uniref:Sushi, von Willebrand factor type A, EGF and pentraxin domain-containing protein 1-like n=1 Tax=Saccoglossus kowalevskii TaxID=10224 RepID=A0ABM0M8U4_SACKO|nr:PREDICTED: sushi, von Willebrand factor type A, EGF and pentraxin domain-containing protein 1-like [Saccoglossus kowalevskii]